MTDDAYTAIPLHDDEKHIYLTSRPSWRSEIFPVLVIIVLALSCFITGFVVGENWRSRGVKNWDSNPPDEDVRLPQQAFIPDVPVKEVTFRFPTEYGDTTKQADQLWNELMPLGSGFLRVPYPRRFDLPPSKTITDDLEEAEIYSMSITHQLHCLGVLRHVIMKYEIGDKSRYAGNGHEYHCLDEIRQGILCSGDTTLDHADTRNAAGRPVGFSGADATHRCRDWEVIKDFLVEMRAGNKSGIL